MHEMSLAEDVLQLINEASVKDQFTKVVTVWLEIGQLSSVEPQSMAFCFDAIKRGSVAAGARLEILALPGVGWCEDCATSVPMSDAFCECPQCGGYQVRITGGTEMRVKELEVE